MTYTLAVLVTRFLFERWGLLIPPHTCSLCGERHWRYSSASLCWVGSCKRAVELEERIDGL